MIKIVIEDEQLRSAAVANAEGDQRDDYDKCVLAALEEKVSGQNLAETPRPSCTMYLTHACLMAQRAPAPPNVRTWS